MPQPALHAEPTAPHPMFIEQAKHLCHGAELLPGGHLALAQRLQHSVETSTPLRIKLGLDPTRPDLHLGHSVVLRKLRAFQDLGHQAVLIIGDATAMIGDPSGRNHTRPPLTEAEVQANAETYLAQAKAIINVDKAEIVRNSSFFNPLGLQELLQLMAQVTVAQLLVREDFNKRYQAQTPISLHEFMYPLMQAYDSVMVRADVELGGTDQRFNNLLGREIQQAYAKLNNQPCPYPQLVLLLPLLEGTDGKVKMSKSYPQHCINLTDSADEQFGKLMSLPDEMILRYEALLTPLTAEQLEQQRQAMALPVDKGGVNPRDVKAAMAKYIVGLYHGASQADEAEARFVDRFRNKQLPTDLPTVSLPLAELPLAWSEVLVRFELASSKSEAKRLIQGGGVRLNGDKLADPEAVCQAEAAATVLVQVGKRKAVNLSLT